MSVIPYSYGLESPNGAVCVPDSTEVGSAIISSAMPSITFRLIFRPPITINGGLNRWIIQKEFSGAADQNVNLVARCIETGETVTLTSGQTKEVGQTIERLVINAEKGTRLAQIGRKLVEEKWAELVTSQIQD